MARIIQTTLMLLALLAFCSPAFAKSNWQVTKVSQPAFFSANGKNWQVVKKGMMLKNHTWITTKSRGRGSNYPQRRCGDVSAKHPSRYPKSVGVFAKI